MKTAILAPALVLLLAGAATSQAAPARLTDQDRKFLAYAAKVNQQEIQMARLAEDKAQSPAVKAFARLMVSDHSGVEGGIAGLSRPHAAHAKARAHARKHRRHPHAAHRVQAHAHPPSPPPKPAPADTATAPGSVVTTPANAAPLPGASHSPEEALSKLKDKSGADFDRAFMAEQVDYHTRNLEKLKEEAKKANSEAVRNFAEKIAGAFKQHLELAKAVKEKENGAVTP